MVRPERESLRTLVLSLSLLLIEFFLLLEFLFEICFVDFKSEFLYMKSDFFCFMKLLETFFEILELNELLTGVLSFFAYDIFFSKASSEFLVSLFLSVEVKGSFLNISLLSLLIRNDDNFGLSNSFKLEGQYPYGPLSVLVFLDIVLVFILLLFSSTISF